MRKNNFLVFGFLLVLLIMPFISSAPPQQISDTTLILESAFPTTHKLGEDYYVHTHVYDKTNEKLVTSGISCYYHFYNHQINGGEHISVGNLTQSGMGYSNTVDGSLINVSGEYSALIWCNSSTQVGFNKYTFKVTPTGEEFTDAESRSYLIVILVLFAFLFASLYGFISIPFQNGRDEEGSLVSINDLKYVKILLGFASYGFFIWVANIMITLSTNYINLGTSLGFFTMMFNALTWLIWPSVIITIIIIVWNMFNDMKLSDLLGRGFSIK